MKKFLFFLGKGGVGKSTLSSATALAVSGSRRVLLVSLDPAHNLGDIFRVRLSDVPQTVAPNLDVLEVDLAHWVRRYLDDSRREIQANYSYTASINLDSWLDIMKYSPGTEEYAVLWAVEHIRSSRAGDYDIVVFDTPPTALTLRFIAMPSVSKLWVEELSRMRKRILEKRQTILKLNPTAPGAVGAMKQADDKVSVKLGSIRGRLAGLEEMFRSESVFSVVANRDELSIAESGRIRDELGRLGLKIDSICLNKSRGDGEHEQTIRREFGCPVFVSGMLEEGMVTRDNLSRVQLDGFISRLMNG